MGYAGVQGMGAFNAQFAWFLVALAGGVKELWARLPCLALAVFAIICVIYTFSRGSYIALLAGWLFVGLVKDRRLLILLAVFTIVWTSVVPNAVQERVFMTYDPNRDVLDGAASVRLDLWSDAVELFESNPILGTGFHTYAYMGRVGNYEDTHNIYLKALVETGVIGLLLFLCVLWKAYRMGFRLFRKAKDPFFAALGLGLAAWIICSATSNLFGDRWTYLQVNGYLWVVAGMAARGLATEVVRERELLSSKAEAIPEGAVADAVSI